MVHLFFRLSRLTDVISLQNHPDHLCGKRDLLLLANQGFYDMLILHIVTALVQSIPRAGLLSFTCLARTSVMVWMGFMPLFSARATGMTSKASAKALIAYCSKVGHLSASWLTARAD